MLGCRDRGSVATLREGRSDYAFSTLSDTAFGTIFIASAVRLLEGILLDSTEYEVRQWG